MIAKTPDLMYMLNVTAYLVDSLTMIHGVFVVAVHWQRADLTS